VCFIYTEREHAFHGEGERASEREREREREREKGREKEIEKAVRERREKPKAILQRHDDFILG
jgi:predicted fused transcriptional regulator/phosphomethylpyrimidine kinase